jgi:hypothetical protein
MSNSRNKLSVSLKLSEKQVSQPQGGLGLVDAIALIVGIVVGADIFEEQKEKV